MFVACLLFLLHIGAINYIHGIIALGAVVIFFYQPLLRHRCNVNALVCPEIWMLILFGITYVLFGEISLLYIEYYLIAPVLAFIIGWVYCECTKESAQAFKKAIFAILLGFGIHVVLNVALNLGSGRLAMVDVFQGKRIATGSGALNTMTVSLVMYSVFLAKGRERIIIMALFCVSLVYCFILGNRSQFAILILVNVCTVSLYLYEKKGARGLVKTLFIIIGVIAALAVVYKLDLFGIGTMINKSNFMLRFAVNSYNKEVEANTSLQNRMRLLAGALEQILKSPFGGNIDRVYYHNLMLDIARVSGIIPMFLMIMYFIRMLRNLLKIFRSGFASDFRYMVVSVYMGFWLNFMVEPVMEGFIEFFLMMCMLDGMVTYIVRYRTPRRLAKGCT